MSRVGNCWGNAVAESFFATLEWELIERANWATRTEAAAEIASYIEIWYNQLREHSSLGGLSPAQYEAMISTDSKAAYPRPHNRGKTSAALVDIEPLLHPGCSA